jgi:hypothetical protein
MKKLKSVKKKKAIKWPSKNKCEKKEKSFENILDDNTKPDIEDKIQWQSMIIKIIVRLVVKMSKLIRQA